MIETQMKTLAAQHKSESQATVNIDGCWTGKGNTFYSIQSNYRDIFLIINMLDDYVKLLTAEEKKDLLDKPYYCYMVEQFKRISESLSSQIELDKEKMYKRCQKRTTSDGIGEDAFVQLMKK